MKNSRTELGNLKVPVKLKLSALWASLMFCYIYADCFALYKSGALQSMLAGNIGPLGPTTLGTSKQSATNGKSAT
jgi:hypothetical protein